MKILAIETSTQAFSVALYDNGSLIEEFAFAPREHARRLLPACESLLNQAGYTLQQMDAIAFGRGPGAFTGLRIAAAAAQGLAIAANLPCIPVSSLAAAALGASTRFDVPAVAVAFDARMGEVYWGSYLCNGTEAIQLDDERVCKPEEVVSPSIKQAVLAVSDGWITHHDLLLEQMAGVEVIEKEGAADWAPHASDVARLAAPMLASEQSFPVELALPVYLRDNVAKRPASMR